VICADKSLQPFNIDFADRILVTCQTLQPSRVRTHKATDW
jgi:hypothetical protein